MSRLNRRKTRIIFKLTATPVILFWGKVISGVFFIFKLSGLRIVARKR